MNLTELERLATEVIKDLGPNSEYVKIATPNQILALISALKTAREALEKSNAECSMHDPNFEEFTKLQFAARLGLIYVYTQKALATLSSVCEWNKEKI